VKILNSISLKKRNNLNDPVKIHFKNILDCYFEKRTMVHALIVSTKSENPFDN
jgi:hypothetical protein